MRVECSPNSVAQKDNVVGGSVVDNRLIDAAKISQEVPASDVCQPCRDVITV